MSLAKIPYDQMDFVWITDHYDIHLSGLCRVDGELMLFKIVDVSDNEMPSYVVYPLTRLQKVKWLWKKWLFEVCIGEHWSYPQRKKGIHFYIKSPTWFWSTVFALYYWKSTKGSMMRTIRQMMTPHNTHKN